MPLSSGKPLYFLSIPKTAGTTLYHILATYFPMDQVAPIQSLRKLIETPIRQIQRYRLIGGHYYYRVEPILGVKPVYITMFRNPVDRVISYYAHILRNPNHYAHHRVHNQTLLEFTEDQENLPLYANAQVRYLGLNRDILGVYKQLDRNSLSQNYFEQLFEQLMEGFAPNGFYDESYLECAKQRLKHFPFFGFKTWFDQSLQLLCRTFGWEIPKHYQKMMVNPNPFKSIDDKAVSNIRKHTQLDHALFEHALVEFKQKYQEKVLE